MYICTVIWWKQKVCGILNNIFEVNKYYVSRSTYAIVCGFYGYSLVFIFVFLFYVLFSNGFCNYLGPSGQQLGYV